MPRGRPDTGSRTRTSRRRRRPPTRRRSASDSVALHLPSARSIRGKPYSLSAISASAAERLGIHSSGRLGGWPLRLSKRSLASPSKANPLFPAALSGSFGYRSGDGERAAGERSMPEGSEAMARAGSWNRGPCRPRSWARANGRRLAACRAAGWGCSSWVRLVRAMDRTAASAEPCAVWRCRNLPGNRNKCKTQTPHTRVPVAPGIDRSRLRPASRKILASRMVEDDIPQWSGLEKAATGPDRRARCGRPARACSADGRRGDSERCALTVSRVRGVRDDGSPQRRGGRRERFRLADRAQHDRRPEFKNDRSLHEKVQPAPFVFASSAPLR